MECPINDNLKNLKSAIMLKNKNFENLEEQNKFIKVFFASEAKSKKFAVAKVDFAIRTSIMKNGNQFLIDYHCVKLVTEYIYYHVIHVNLLVIKVVHLTDQ